jgi:hypothetical protein
LAIDHVSRSPDRSAGDDATADHCCRKRTGTAANERLLWNGVTAGDQSAKRQDTKRRSKATLERKCSKSLHVERPLVRSHEKSKP